MSFTSALQTRWQQLRDAVSQDDRQKLIEGLHAEYQAEAHEAVQLLQHARRMYYPQFRERLLQIAAQEHEHVQWLGEKILALGGELPPVAETSKLGKNSWECLLMDLEEKKRRCTELMERIRMARQADPEVAEGLLRIQVEEQRHHEEIRDMLFKSEPDAPPTPTVQPEELEKRKHEWLAQQKMEWLEQQRAEWEAGGKLTPWGEWIGEQEYRWVVNELPNRELAWARQLAEREIESDLSLHSKM